MNNQASTIDPGAQSIALPAKAAGFIVRHNETKCAMFFIKNVCMKCVSHVHDDDTRVFDTEEDADATARIHGLNRGEYTIEPAPLSETNNVKKKQL